MKIRRSFEVYFLDTSTTISLPFYEFGLTAGFPSPAQNYIAPKIDLNFALMLDADNTRIYKVQDDDLEKSNLFNDDWAILQTDLQPKDGDMVYCLVDGEPMNRLVSFDYTKKQVKLISTHDKSKFL